MSPAQPNLAGRRILVGPNDVAGFASRIAVALASGGANVGFFNGFDHAFNPHLKESATLRRWFGPAISVATRWKNKGGLARVAGKILARIVKTIAFFRTCCWAQCCVMVGGKGFFSGGFEYAFLRLLGKRVIHVFVGTASRPRYQSGYAKTVLRCFQWNGMRCRGIHDAGNVRIASGAGVRPSSGAAR